MSRPRSTPRPHAPFSCSGTLLMRCSAIWVAAGHIPADIWEKKTRAKLEGFHRAYGTVMFIVDLESLAPLKEQSKAFCGQIRSLGFSVWTALQGEELRANLQHCNPLIHGAVQKQRTNLVKRPFLPVECLGK
ncbi:hypothetical protein ASPZODRAFT_889408 [Penicilliopsis zonata CBS 506.65]|uniref:Uncharacterized protein n=1 Tax=Penicilliopsis zonata CBS 506.65 TaxID=1073090 RepID=A0A1L9S9N1_9EURO|nr:hypothetical protein ASPZODRAFT_889408 [Penicilliopsis zonata CBS 506.65]OJJ43870.1 hypothetical protein ASPZODRAFT_889408 [Penicilliopsis zonata CBS 506.65]